MGKYTKQQAIKTITTCASAYCAELLDRSLLFIVVDKHKKIDAMEVTSFERNFLHLTGLTVDKSIMASDSFLKKCRDRKLSPDDFEFKADGTTFMKLDVLPALITKNLSANMVGDYNHYGFELYTEKLAGGVKGCIGFRMDAISKMLVPNTILNYDIRKCTKDTRGRVLATFRKERSGEVYSEIVYKAKKVDWSKVTFPDGYSYLSGLVEKPDSSGM